MTGDSSGGEDVSEANGEKGDTKFFDSFPDPVVRYRVQNDVPEIRAVNTAFASLFDVDEEEAVGDSLEPYLRAVTVDRILDTSDGEATTTTDSTDLGERADEKMATTGAVLTHLRSESDPIVIARVDANDERRYVQFRQGQVGDNTGDAYLVFTDVTDIERRARECERSAKRLERFSSVAAHDIRNPLEVAEIRLEAAQDTHEDVHFEKVAGSLDRIEQIVEDVLSVGGAAIEPSETVAVGECAEAAWDTVDTADATLTVSTTRSVRADRSRLQQLFENLFRNAVEHGGRDVSVTVGSLEDGFYVADDGAGIPDDQRERVFEAGYSATDDNTGLGLAIVEQIAAAHGWRVGLTTSDSGGARFEFTGVEEVDKAD